MFTVVDFVKLLIKKLIISIIFVVDRLWNENIR